MSNKNFDDLISSIESDVNLSDAIKQASSTKEIIEICNSNGFNIELDDLYQNADRFNDDDYSNLQLTSSELETVAAGKKKKGTAENPWTTEEKRRCQTCSVGVDCTLDPDGKKPYNPPKGDYPDCPEGSNPLKM
tara:strand:+ start:494 stop:895 length:402 start_codon:yes stop_codon:yes gene_type:complete